VREGNKKKRNISLPISNKQRLTLFHSSWLDPLFCSTNDSRRITNEFGEKKTDKERTNKATLIPSYPWQRRLQIILCPFRLIVPQHLLHFDALLQTSSIMSDIIAEYDAMLCMRPPNRRAGKKDAATVGAKDATTPPEATSTAPLCDAKAPNDAAQTTTTTTTQNGDDDAATTTTTTTTTNLAKPESVHGGSWWCNWYFSTTSSRDRQSDYFLYASSFCCCGRWRRMIRRTDKSTDQLSEFTTKTTNQPTSWPTDKSTHGSSYTSVPFSSSFTTLFRLSYLGRVSSEDEKRVCYRWTHLQREHIFKIFKCPTREWVKWAPKRASKASVAKRSAVERVSGVSGASVQT